MALIPQWTTIWSCAVHRYRMKLLTPLVLGTALIALTIFVFHVPGRAQTAAQAPRMSGQDLIDNFRVPPGEDVPMNPRRLFTHQLARGYLDGINDATEGLVWCYRGRLKPIERDYELIAELAKLPHATLKGNAAPLALDFLRKKYPCPSTPDAKRVR